MTLEINTYADWVLSLVVYLPKEKIALNSGWYLSVSRCKCLLSLAQCEVHVLFVCSFRLCVAELLGWGEGEKG